MEWTTIALAVLNSLQVVALAFIGKEQAASSKERNRRAQADTDLQTGSGE
jgi:hypothetical protein